MDKEGKNDLLSGFALGVALTLLVLMFIANTILSNMADEANAACGGNCKEKVIQQMKVQSALGY